MHVQVMTRSICQYKSLQPACIARPSDELKRKKTQLSSKEGGHSRRKYGCTTKRRGPEKNNKGKKLENSPVTAKVLRCWFVLFRGRRS
eukprot:6131753-Amphidinium_carterae.1